MTDYEVLPAQKVRHVGINLAKHTCGKNRATTAEGIARKKERKRKKITQPSENC